MSLFRLLTAKQKAYSSLNFRIYGGKQRKQIVFVTHNVEEAVLLADRVVVMAANPGRIKNIFEIKLARPREAQSVDLSYVAREVMRDLKEEVEKVAKTEYDSDWNFQKSSVLYNSDSDLGANL